jgi:hypothetical protein
VRILAAKPTSAWLKQAIAPLIATTFAPLKSGQRLCLRRHHRKEAQTIHSRELRTTRNHSSGSSAADLRAQHRTRHRQPLRPPLLHLPLLHLPLLHLPLPHLPKSVQP